MRRKWRQKQPLLFDALMEEQIKYPLLYYADSLYLEQLHKLKNSQFNAFIRKTLRNLSPLLSLNTNQFFELLEKNETIRTCLESCLATFPRRAYGRFYDERQAKKNINSKDKSFIIYATLMKVVLFIFYRISSAKQKVHRQIVYNQFLLDIPKLLDIVAIYGCCNGKIVQQLVNNTYEISADYDRDTIDFFNYVYNGKFDEMQRNKHTTINFSAQYLKPGSFGNPQKYMISKVVATLFTVKDILFNLTNFIKFFPKNYVYQLVSDYKIQQKLIEGVTFFIHQAQKGWNLNQYKQKYFALHFEDLRQSMVLYFIEQFKILKQIITSKQDIAKAYIQCAHNTYQTYCLILKTQKHPFFFQYQKIINNLIQETQDEIFFLRGSQVLGGNKKTKSAVEHCQAYQKDYRNNKKMQRNMDLDKIEVKNKQNLKKFRQIWISAQEQKAKEKSQNGFKRIEDYELNAYINNIKYGRISRQYDDEPEQYEFNQVVLANQHQKLPKKELNLSFKKAKPAKNQIRYVQKTVSYDKITQNTDLSFFSIPRQQASNHLDLSISAKEDKFEDLDISIIQPNLSINSDIDDQAERQLLTFEWNEDNIGQMYESQLSMPQYTHNKQQNLSFIRS